MRNKVPVNLSVSPDTKERLKVIAEQKHTTVSQLVTDWVWAQPVKETDTGVEEK